MKLTIEWKIAIGFHGCSVALVTMQSKVHKYLINKVYINMSLTSQYYVIHDMLLSRFWRSAGSGMFGDSSQIHNPAFTDQQ